MAQSHLAGLTGTGWERTGQPRYADDSKDFSSRASSFLNCS
jgi:hypothetical protein